MAGAFFLAAANSSLTRLAAGRQHVLGLGVH